MSRLPATLKRKLHLKNLFKNETGTALESERLIETVGTMDYYKLLQVDWCTDKSQCGKWVTNRVGDKKKIRQDGK